MAGTSVPVPDPVSAASAQALLEQINQLQERIKALVQTGGCYADMQSQVDTARSQLTNGNFVGAQVTYAGTASAVCRAEASSQAEPMAWMLLWVELAYLVAILVLGYLVQRYPDFWLWAGLVGLYAKAAWFGSVGGVTIGIYGLYTHISAKDFDPTFRLWYICKPVMGAIFGWFVVVAFYVGLVSAEGSTVHVNVPQVTYAIAFLAGFSERFTIKTIDRLMTVLTVGEDTSKTKDKDKPKVAGSSLLP
ncbi:MAG TPA: hypothetical protein VFE61_09950 [Candidatus Sulfotelmatobacter sp.]|jgi:RsiW-degrading membrane proteinase PrsW (M82 family)|nr:hypothetical protein [Candidatus Sulfotelmatobacter sp.]